MRPTRMLPIVLLALSAALNAQTSAELGAEKWRQDLAVLADQLPKLHKNLFFQQPKAEFDRQVHELDAKLPNLNEGATRAALVRLLASVGNEHTTIDALRGTSVFPLQFAIFPEGTYVTAAGPDHQDAIGRRLVSIDGVPVAHVRARLAPYYAKENAVAELLFVPGLMRNAVVLNAAGITASPANATFQFEDAALALDATKPPVATKGPAGVLARKTADYWYEYKPESKAVYIQYNACRNSKDRSFLDFTNDLVRAVASKPVSTYIVDLRFNGGGDSKIVQPLVKALKAAHRTRVFVLVGRETFSSAFLAAMELRRECRGTLVGEAMGQRPNSYGDIRPLKLPNSGLTAYYCTKYFKLSPKDVPQVEPDVPIPLTAADYFAGKDPVLAYALSAGSPTFLR